MAQPPLPDAGARLLGRDGLDALIGLLRRRGYTVVGPKVRDEAIVYDGLGSSSELPEGVGDEQAPGRYRLRPRGDKALFGYNVGPHSWKKYLFPPQTRLFSARRVDGRLRFQSDPVPEARYAFLGIRACELAALGIQDKVFLAAPYADPHYRALRERLFLIAVQCTEAGALCFCDSMGAGPAPRGFDLALTERVRADGSDFVAVAGTSEGRRVLAELPGESAPHAAVRAAEEAVAACGRSQAKRMDAEGLPEVLKEVLDHPRWAETAQRCLACANCTMACPTCFCSTVEETGDLTGDHSERWRRWDSCFTTDFTHLHGGPVRASVRDKYRQWLTHKLGTWHDQFGSSGCVGCGRCIAWCPVGIDITEEVRALRANGPGGTT